MTATVARVQGLRALSPIPKQGTRFLSVNAAVADVGRLWQMAQDMDLSPELVQIPYRDGTEVHVLFWQGAMVEDRPSGSNAGAPGNLESVFDELCGQFGSDAVRYASGRERVA